MDRKLPSNRSFGLSFFAIFAAWVAYSLFRHHYNLSVGVAAFAAMIFFILAIAAPNTLYSLNVAWFKLGEVLGKVVSPVIVGGIFLFVLTPVAVLLRIAGRDELSLRPATVKSWWIDRGQPESFPSDGFKNQF